jgi:hypothetical protein
MLSYQFANHISDLASLGSASNRLNLLDISLLPRYERILAVFDADPAGDLARNRLSENPRIDCIHPPDHDLTDYWQYGNDLQSWIISQI